MKMSELDKQLLDFQQQKEKSWGKIITLLKKQFDSWATEELLTHGYADFKMSYMPLLVNISPEGITNNELAKKARVTKQAMSKIVNELMAMGYVETKTLGQDKRSANVHLTAKGKKLLITAKTKVQDLEGKYEQLLGKKRFVELKNMLKLIIENHDTACGAAL
jgi:DNA-binding MarR family transcriptional regulator